MNIDECIRLRRSVRKYSDEPVTKEMLEKVIATAAYAPSWKNSQTTRYIIITNKAVKEQLADNCLMGFEPNQKTLHNAPAIILVTTIAKRSGYERDGSFSTSKGEHWESFDAGISTQTLCLAACNAGLATVILGIFDEKKVRQIARIPEEQKLSAMIAIGHPAESPAMPKRKEVEVLLTYIE